MATVGSILQVIPAEWVDDVKTNEYSIQRTFQWTRNGIDISGAIGAVYTLQTADIGATISVRETSGFISPSNNGKTPETPSVTSSSTATGLSVTGSALDTLLVQKSNLEYKGSFYMPLDKFNYNGTGLAFNPSGFGSQKTLTAFGRVDGPVVGTFDYFVAGEFSIPTLTDSDKITNQASLATLQASTLLRPTPNPLDPCEGGRAASGVVGDAQSYRYTGIGVAPSGKMLFSYQNAYSNPQAYSVFYRRPFDLSVTGSVEGPFIVIDTTYQTNPRWTGGWICPIPSTTVSGVNYQTALGGDFLAGANGLSVLESASDGPSAISFSSSAITAALATGHSGTAQGGTTNTIRLADSANSTDGYYEGQYIVAASACTGARKISAYVGSTRTATINIDKEAKLWDVATPTTSTTYKTTPYVSGRQLIGYLPNTNLVPGGGPTTPLDDGYGSNKYASIWGVNGTAWGMVIPNGTKSLLFIGRSGDNYSTYGNPGAIDEKLPLPPELPKIFDTEDTARSPHSYAYTGKIWAYNLDELAAVYANPGTVGFNSVKPYSIWNFDLPGAGTLTDRVCNGAAYDPSTRTIYISATVNDAPVGYSYGRVVVHAYLVNNAVAV